VILVIFFLNVKRAACHLIDRRNKTFTKKKKHKHTESDTGYWTKLPPHLPYSEIQLEKCCIFIHPVIHIHLLPYQAQNKGPQGN
jgi:hypothetical protein